MTRVLPLYRTYQTSLQNEKSYRIPNGLPFCRCNLGLCTIEHFLELGHAEAHPRVHVRFRALDVIVEIIAEELDVRNGGVSHVGFFEMAREENYADPISNHSES